MSSPLLRTRWAAIGAAIAVTLGAGGYGFANAALDSGDRPVYVAITPCRILDTRADSVVHPRHTPLGPGETHTQNAHGNNGLCTGIPTDATALALNATALGATTPGAYLTFWPTGTPQPNASSLNPAPGQPPTPNAVITAISAGGQFNVFNYAGTIDLIIDVTGYYIDHNHDDRYYTKSAVDTTIGAINTTLGNKADTSNVYTKAQVDTTIGTINATLGNKANTGDVYSKAQVDQRAPKVNTMSIGSAAFTPGDSTLAFTKTSGMGGVYVTGGSFGRMVAPVVFPDGARVTSAVVHFVDQSTHDLNVSISCERNGSGFAGFASFSTNGNTSSSRSGNMSGLPKVVDNANCAYYIDAYYRDWALAGSDLRVGSVKITYEMPA